MNAKDTLALVEKTFGHIPAKKLPNRQDVSEPNTQAKGAKVVMGGNTKQPMFTLGYRVPTLTQLDEKLPYALDMLANILSGNSAARFDKKLIRGSELALDLSTNYTMIDRQAQLFTISGMPSQRSDLDLLRKNVEAEIALIARDGVSEEELQRAKTLETNGFSYDDENKLRQRIDQVTASDVQAAAAFLLKQRDVFVQLYPEDSEQVKAAKKTMKPYQTTKNK